MNIAAKDPREEKAFAFAISASLIAIVFAFSAPFCG
jgi:hypothetical protein